jgi:2-keto-3-deoxy-L-rhamnonate aldolase RhmA
MWSRGLDYGPRNTDIQRIYAGEPDADALLRQYGVDYVLIGPAEFAASKVNEPFWSQHTQVWQAGAYRVYQTGIH